MRSWILALLLMALLGIPRPVTAEEHPPVSLELYREAVERAWQQLEDYGSLDGARAELAPITRVRLRSGEEIRVAPVLDTVVTLEEARARLSLLRQELDAALAADPASALAILEELRQRLGLGRRSLWQRFLDGLRALLETFQSPGELSLQAPETLVIWALSLVAVLLLGGLLGIWLRDLLALWVSEPSRRGQARERELPVRAAQAQERAQIQARAGNYREAVRMLYLAALLHLAESNHLRFEPSLTNREILEQVPEDTPWRRDLEPVIAVFDRVWYGVQEPNQETFRRYQTAVQHLIQAVQPQERIHGMAS